MRKLEKNQEIETIVLSIDADRERISLGIKQLKADAFNEFILSNKKGSRVIGKVNNITDERIVLDLSEGVQGFLPQKDFTNSSQESTLDKGLEIEVIVANINQKDREIIVSLRALEKADERAALKENVKKNLEIEETSKSNIGDMIKAELEEKEDE